MESSSKVIKCNIGELFKTEEQIIILKLTCTGKEISSDEILEVAKTFDELAGNSAIKVLVDTSEPHSVSFEALNNMGASKKISAVALYAENLQAKSMAKFIEHYQNQVATAPYPFKSFSDFEEAREWLKSLD